MTKYMMRLKFFINHNQGNRGFGGIPGGTGPPGPQVSTHYLVYVTYNNYCARQAICRYPF